MRSKRYRHVCSRMLGRKALAELEGFTWDNAHELLPTVGLSATIQYADEGKGGETLLHSIAGTCLCSLRRYTLPPEAVVIPRQPFECQLYFFNAVRCIHDVLQVKVHLGVAYAVSPVLAGDPTDGILALGPSM